MPKQSIAQHDNVEQISINFKDTPDEMDISADPLLPNEEDADNIEARIQDEVDGAVQLAKTALDALKEPQITTHGAFRTAFGIRNPSNSEIIRKKLVKRFQTVIDLSESDTKQLNMEISPLDVEGDAEEGSHTNASLKPGDVITTYKKFWHLRDFTFNKARGKSVPFDYTLMWKLESKASCLLHEMFHLSIMPDAHKILSGADEFYGKYVIRPDKGKDEHLSEASNNPESMAQFATAMRYELWSEEDKNDNWLAESDGEDDDMDVDAEGDDDVESDISVEEASDKE